MIRHIVFSVLIINIAFTVQGTMEFPVLPSSEGSAVQTAESSTVSTTTPENPTKPFMMNMYQPVQSVISKTANLGNNFMTAIGSSKEKIINQGKSIIMDNVRVLDPITQVVILSTMEKIFDNLLMPPLNKILVPITRELIENVEKQHKAVNENLQKSKVEAVTEMLGIGNNLIAANLQQVKDQTNDFIERNMQELSPSNKVILLNILQNIFNDILKPPLKMTLVELTNQLINDAETEQLEAETENHHADYQSELTNQPINHSEVKQLQVEKENRYPDFQSEQEQQTISDHQTKNDTNTNNPKTDSIEFKELWHLMKNYAHNKIKNLFSFRNKH